jgi:uncharacterized protein (TIGR03083 family)
MEKPDPVLVTQLFPELLGQLLEVLQGLSPEEWEKPSLNPGWSVRDVALHLLGGDIGQLSAGRDKLETTFITTSHWKELVARLNERNENWVTATRGFSPRLICDLLKLLGDQVHLYFESLDPYSTGPVVSWAGPSPAPMWLHIARQYTERWHHQQQIRETDGRPLLTDPKTFAPVLATFVHALPRTYEHLTAPDATIVKLTIVGESGGSWFLVRESDTWVLFVDDEVTEATAHVAIGEEDAWRLFTKSVTKEEVQPRIRMVGDENLALNALETVSMIA